MSKDIFEFAEFGDKFVDAGGRLLIYHYKEEHKSSDGKIWMYHYLIRQPEKVVIDGHEFESHHYNSYVNIDGQGIPSNLKYYNDIQKSVNGKYVITHRYHLDPEAEEL